MGWSYEVARSSGVVPNEGLASFLIKMFLMVITIWIELREGVGVIACYLLEYHTITDIVIVCNWKVFEFLLLKLKKMGIFKNRKKI